MDQEEDFATAERYGARAEEIRVIASGMRDRGCRESLFRTADVWDNLAAQMLRMAHSY